MIENGFPIDWRDHRLEDVAVVQGGLQVTSGRKENPLDVPYLRVANVHRDRLDLAGVKTIRVTHLELERTLLKEGDLLVVEGHGSKDEIGRTAVWDGSITPCVHQNHLIRARFDQGVALPAFVSAYLNSSQGRLQLFRAGKTTSGLNTINVNNVKRLRLCLPPVPEQRRIAAILDKANAIRRKRQQAIQLTEALLRSVFLDMFGDPVTNPKGWPVVDLGNLGVVQGGLQVTSRRSSLPIEVPYLRVANVFRDSLDLSEVKTIRVTESELNRASLEEGDILIVEGHGNPAEIGRASAWDGSIDPCVHQNHLIRVRINRRRAEPRFVSAFLNSAGGRRQLRVFGKTTSGLNTISTSNVRRTRILLPPIALQKRWCNIIDRDGMVARGVAAGCHATDALLGSLHFRLLRGERDGGEISNVAFR